MIFTLYIFYYVIHIQSKKEKKIQNSRFFGPQKDKGRQEYASKKDEEGAKKAKRIVMEWVAFNKSAEFLSASRGGGLIFRS